MINKNSHNQKAEIKNIRSQFQTSLLTPVMLTERSTISRGSKTSTSVFIKSNQPLKRKIGGLARRWMAKEKSRNTI